MLDGLQVGGGAHGIVAIGWICRDALICKQVGALGESVAM